MPDSATVIQEDTILPGFIDCHTHLVGMQGAGYLGEQAPFGDMLLGVVYQAGLLLDAGFTRGTRYEPTGLLLGPRTVQGHHLRTAYHAGRPVPECYRRSR